MWDINNYSDRNAMSVSKREKNKKLTKSAKKPTDCQPTVFENYIVLLISGPGPNEVESA